MKEWKMSEQAREARRSYMAIWRKNNRDKARDASIRYWEKVAREKQEQTSKSY